MSDRPDDIKPARKYVLDYRRHRPYDSADGEPPYSELDGLRYAVYRCFRALVFMGLAVGLSFGALILAYMMIVNDVRLSGFAWAWIIVVCLMAMGAWSLWPGRRG